MGCGVRQMNNLGDHRCQGERAMIRSHCGEVDAHNFN